MIVQEFDAFESMCQCVLIPQCSLGAIRSISGTGSPDALPGICPLLAFDDTLFAEVPPFRFSPF